MNKEVIKNNFSKNAASYDEYAAVQKKCAERLIDMTKGREFGRILEIGCGTGIYTRFLLKEHPSSEITAIDISEEMLKIAQKKFPYDNVNFVEADAENIDVDKKPDLVTSNVSFQWFQDFDSAIKLFSENLREKGILCFSMYGPDTFMEFKEVLDLHFGRRRWLSSSRFLGRIQVENILKKYFKKYELAEEHFVVGSFSLWDFLVSIKRTGIRGDGLADEIFLGKNTIEELEQIYIKRFGRVSSTHHIFFGKAEV